MTARTGVRIPRPQTAAPQNAPPAPVAARPDVSSATGFHHRLADIDVGVERGAAVQPVTQRKVQVKDGTIYTTAAEVVGNAPDAKIDGSLKARVEDPAALYLAKSKSDVLKRAAGTKTPMLTPHRHLIGEFHNDSKFGTASEDWGWKAALMAEGVQTSALVSDPLSEETMAKKRYGMFANPLYGATPLENLHPFVLSGLSVGVTNLHRARVYTATARVNAEDYVASNKQNERDKAFFEQSIESAAGARAEFGEAWTGDVEPHLPGYKAACARQLIAGAGATAGTQALHDLALTMFKLWDTLAARAKAATAKPFSVFDTWPETVTKLNAAVLADDVLESDLRAFADALVKLTKAEIDASPELTQTGVDPAADFAKATGGGIGSDPLVDIGPMREIFMVQNINRLAKPGLVLIGSAHVDRIKARIVDGKFHALYPDFERDLLT